MSAGPTGIVMMNLGGPKTLDDVNPFLRALFADLPEAVADLAVMMAGERFRFTTGGL